MVVTTKRGRRRRAEWLAGAVLVALAPLLLVACGDEAPAAPDGDPSITGIVTAADPGADVGVVGSFRIDDGTGEYDAAMVRVSDETAWYRAAGGATEPVDAPAPDALVGRRVAVRFSGPVAESYPVQAVAGWVVVYD
jgi:hypothetical protein